MANEEQEDRLEREMKLISATNLINNLEEKNTVKYEVVKQN